MSSISIKAMRGQVPRLAPRMLGDMQAQVAMNCKIAAGRLEPYKGLALEEISALGTTIKTLYRYRVFNTISSEFIERWMTWGVTVDACRSPVSQETLGRLYFTGDGEPRMTTYADAIYAGGPFPTGYFTLGVAAPVTAATLSVGGGSGTTESRAYVYTFVTKYGEESGPSPAVLVSGFINGSWNLSAMDGAPPNSGTVSAAVTDTPTVGQVTATLDTVFGLAKYEQITFASVGGMTDLNGTFQIQSIDVAAKKVVVNLATSQTYTSGGAWDRVTPHNTSSMTRRIYRTVGTGADYKFVDEVAVGTTSYADTIASTLLGAAIPSLYTLPPPKDLHSLVALANGSMAGLSGNELCLCEIGKPHSWPIANRYAFPARGVALAVAANSVLILTDGFPQMAVATVPEAASMSTIESYAPCLSKPGAVDIGSGCIYPSHDGLYLATPNGTTNLTSKLFRQEQWSAFSPSTMVGAFMDGQYFARYDDGDTSRVMVFDVSEPDCVTVLDDQFDAMYRNPYDGLLYVTKANTIYRFDAEDGARYQMTWRSKAFQLAKPENFGAAQVIAEYGDIVPLDTTAVDANTALMADADNVDGEIGSTEVGVYEIGGSALGLVAGATARSVQFSLVRDGVIVFSRGVSNALSFKLPTGMKDDVWSLEISSTIPVDSMAIAGSVEELRKAQ